MEHEEQPSKGFHRTAYLFAGHGFVALGIIGAILPLMPTTIFLLLAAGCYAKSSPQLYEWLHTNRYFGSYLKNYREKRGTPLSVKIGSMAVLWASIGYTIVFTKAPIYVDVILILIAVGVSIHLIMIKTLKKEN
ncbi:YbaN family protein [bacterium]|nr:YbaN family protein [bacterium]